MDSSKFEKIEKICQSALELPPEKRSTFLEEACGDDSDLRLEVESLLSFERTSDALINQTPDSLAAEMFSELSDTSFVGKEISNYKIVSQIGKGGMGIVYRAIDKTLDRPIAIKFLNQSFISEKDRLHRFRIEARSASALNHPNIITIHEIAEIDGRHFMATEFIEGETLRKRLENNPLNLMAVIKIAIQIASALDAAHRAGIIHRDIKPANIMIRPDGLVKILDFGIAKLSERKIEFDTQDKSQIHTVTEPGMIIGTANYMSPEQARGKKVDAQTDIFSFGVVLYLMLSGKLPFEGETSSDVIASILTEEPKSLDEFSETIPIELKAIVDKSLEKDKKNRFQTAGEMLGELKQIRKQLEFAEEELESPIISKKIKEQKQTDLKKVPTGDAFQQTSGNGIQNTITAENTGNFIPRRNLAFLGGFGISVLLLVMIVFSYSYFTDTSNKIESIAILPFINESKNEEIEYITDGMTEALINNLSQISELSVKSRHTVFRYKGKEISPKKIGEELNVQTVLIGRLVQKGEEISLNLELIDTGKEITLWGEKYGSKTGNLLVLQREITKDISNKFSLKLNETEKEKLAKNYTTNSEAYQAYLKGRFHWNKREGDSITKGIENFEKAIEIDPNFALAWSGLADSYSIAPFYTSIPKKEATLKAKRAALQAIKIAPELAEAYASLSNILSTYEWNFAEAEKKLEKAIELNPKYTTAYEWKAFLLGQMARYDEAIASSKKAVELEPFSLTANFRLGSNLYQAGRFDDALEQFDKTLDLYPETSFVKSMKAKVLREKGETQKAAKILREIIAEDGRKPHNLRILAITYVAEGKKAEAKRLLQEILELKKQGKGDYWNLACIYARLDKNEKAFEYLNKSLQEKEGSITYLKRDINFQGLRTTPRFNKLLKEIGL